MGSDYFMADTEPDGLIVELTCRQFAKVWPNRLYIAYYQKITEAYGASAIFAWQNRTVVGFLPFEPVNCGVPALPNCIHYVTGQFGEPDEARSEMIAQSTATPFADLHSKTLKVHCINVKQAFRRRGLGSAMARYLVEWARPQGWERIEGSAFLDGDWGWLPNVEFWEKVGFVRGNEKESTLEFGPSIGFHMDLKSKP